MAISRGKVAYETVWYTTLGYTVYKDLLYFWYLKIELTCGIMICIYYNHVFVSDLLFSLQKESHSITNPQQEEAVLLDRLHAAFQRYVHILTRKFSLCHVGWSSIRVLNSIYILLTVFFPRMWSILHNILHNTLSVSVHCGKLATGYRSLSLDAEKASILHPCASIFGLFYTPCICIMHSSGRNCVFICITVRIFGPLRAGECPRSQGR